MNLLFLDDDPNRVAILYDKIRDGILRRPVGTRIDVRWVQTAGECIEAMASDTKWDMVCLDHDLGGEIFVESGREDCGMEVIRWMKERAAGSAIPLVVVHTHNPIAAKVMAEELRASGHVERVDQLPFGTTAFWAALRHA